MHLGWWGSRSSQADMDGQVTAVSAMFALEGRFDSAEATGLTAEFVMHFGDDHFTVYAADGQIRITREPAAEPDAVIDTDIKTFSALITKRLRLPDATDSGQLHLTGSAGMVEKLLGAVHAPDSRSDDPTAPRVEG